MQPIILSRQQQKVINEINNYNIILDCVPGSGKTTTIIHIAKEHQTKKILVLTYNAKLKEESREKVKALQLNNCEVHSYHSFYNKYYRECIDDGMMLSILKFGCEPKNKYAFNMIILDEAQDITPIYYSAICKIVKDNNKSIKMAIFGDRKQSIYTYKQADSRFLEQASKLFYFGKYNNSKWKRVNLDITFRLTNKIASFVNNCIIDNDASAVKLKSANLIKNTPTQTTEIKYLICNTLVYDKANEVYKIIKSILSGGYMPGDIFVLSPSIKSSKAPVRILANILSNDGIKIFYPEDGCDKIDEKIINNKLCFSSFHQVKGLERKVVVIFNFDNSYYEFYDKKADRDKCPNTLYVALTRAKQYLVLVHSMNFGFLPFINSENLLNNCDINYYAKTDNIHKKKQYHLITAKTLVEYIESNIITEISQTITHSLILGKKKLELSKLSVKGNISESVNNINKIAIPAYLEYLYTGTTYIHNDNEPLPDSCSVDKFLRMAAEYYSVTENMQFKINQIPNFNWISQSNFNECARRMMKVVNKGALFNIRLSVIGNRQLCEKKIECNFDCIDGSTAWFFFFNKKIESSMIILLAIYSYILRSNKFNVKLLQPGTIIKYRVNETLDGNSNVLIGKIINFSNNNKTLLVEPIHNTEKVRISSTQVFNYFDNVKKIKFYNPLTEDILSIDNNINEKKIIAIINKLLVKKYSDNDSYLVDSRFIETMKLIRFKYFSDIFSG